MSTASHDQDQATNKPKPKPKVRASIVVHPDGQSQSENGNQPEFYALEDNSSVIIGCDDTCGIQLFGDRVAPKHSMLQMVEGEVIVGDWFSDIGTFINGRPVNEPTKIEMLDTLEVGSYRLRVVVHPANENREAMEDFPELSSSQPSPMEAPCKDANLCDDANLNEQAKLSETQIEDTMPTSSSEKLETMESVEASQECVASELEREVAESRLAGAESDLPQQLQMARQQIENLEKELEYQLSIQAADENDAGEFSDDENEMLREEVVHLQTELAQREQELKDAQENGSLQPNIEPSETTKLVDRLEALLDELQSADQRVLSLEDMMRATDEAYQTERESHKQIEDWITELEKRVAARDEEWQAREERLKLQLEESQQLRQETESRLVKTTSNPASPALNREYESQIAELRTKNASMAGQLEKADCEVNRLNQLIETVGSSEIELNQLAEHKQQLREKELEMSQKSSEISHQRAELTKMRDEMERLASEIKPGDPENDNLKLRAFREHLREIHEEDKMEKQGRSLATRISKLWNRLDRR